MDTRTPSARRATRGAGAVLGLLLLAGCNPETIGAGGASSEKVTVAGRSVTIAAPAGLCVDTGSTRVDTAGAFILLQACGDGPATRPPRTSVTASVSSGGLTGEGDATSSLEDLRDYLATTDGRALLGRSGRGGDRVRVLSEQMSNGVLFVLVEDRGPQPIAGLDRTFWRAFLEVNDRMTVLSVLGFSGADPAENLRQLAAVASAIRAANPA